MWVSIIALTASAMDPELAKVLAFPMALFNALKFMSSSHPWVHAWLVVAFGVGFNSQQFLLHTLGNNVDGRGPQAGPGETRGH